MNTEWYIRCPAVLEDVDTETLTRIIAVTSKCVDEFDPYAACPANRPNHINLVVYNRLFTEIFQLHGQFNTDNVVSAVTNLVVEYLIKKHFRTMPDNICCFCRAQFVPFEFIDSEHHIKIHEGKLVHVFCLLTYVDGQPVDMSLLEGNR